MLNLKLQYFGYLMHKTDSFEKTLMLGKIEGRRRRGKQRLRWLHGITDSMDMSLSKQRAGDGQGKNSRRMGSLGLPRWLSGKESGCQCRRSGSIPGLDPREDPLEKETATHSGILT